MVSSIKYVEGLVETLKLLQSSGANIEVTDEVGFVEGNKDEGWRTFDVNGTRTITIKINGGKKHEVNDPLPFFLDVNYMEALEKTLFVDDKVS